MKVSERKYEQNKVISFSNTKGLFGGLSNMAPGYSLFVNEINIANTEALYQACRFPLFPDLQEKIINQKSPMDSKKISQQHLQYTRQDWDNVKFEIMKWCLQVKLIQNWDKFSNLLLSTNEKLIVEYSIKDNVWGACPDGSGNLVGKNALGRLLMELRENILLEKINLQYVQPINIPAFILFGNSISKVYCPEYDFLDFENNFEYEMQ